MRMDKRHRKCTAIALLLIFWDCTATATPPISQLPFPSLKNTYYHSIGVEILSGIAASSLTNHSVINLNPFATNAYFSNNQTNWNVFSGISVQYIRALPHHLSITVGPAAYYTNLDKTSGTVYLLYNLGPHDSLNYQFSTQSMSVMLESHLAYTHYSWQPFVILGAGNAWNNLYQYGETPTDPGKSAIPSPYLFTGNTMSAFAYEVGAGVKHPFYKDRKHHIIYQMSLGYRYFNLGGGRLGPSAAQTTTQTIRLPTIDAQTILFSVSALFGQ